MSKSKVLFLVSGSIAAFKACQVVSHLVKEGHEVQVVATSSALQFIGAATFEGLTGRPVLSDLWQSGLAMDHIRLSRWADYGVLCPASAQSLAKASLGLADDLVGALILAWPKGKRLIFIPAMNHEMFSAPPTQEHLQRLSARGFEIAPTQTGSLACGEEGAGRMLEVTAILEQLNRASSRLGPILITGGATREPIDGIRFLSNVSTGQTAATLADLFMARGWEITYLHGQDAQVPQSSCTRLAFSSFQNLNEQLRTLLAQNDFAAVIHSAAVSDYSVPNSQPERKMSSEQDLTLHLKRNFKILPRLKEYSRHKAIRVIGFKLTLNASEEENLQAARSVLDPSVDAVVANDWRQVVSDRTRHPGHFIRTDGEPLAFGELSELASHLHTWLVPNEIRRTP